MKVSTFTISRSSLSIKVIGSMSRSMSEKMIIYLVQLAIPLYVTYRPLRSRSHIEIKVNSMPASNQGHSKERCSYEGGLHLNLIRSCI